MYETAKTSQIIHTHKNTWWSHVLCSVEEQRGQFGQPAQANAKHTVPDFPSNARAEVEKTCGEQEHDKVESVVDIS